MSVDTPNPTKLIFDRSDATTPVVTVAIPTYRREEMLLEALVSALDQDVEIPIEIIIVDNDPDSRGNVMSSVDLSTSRHSVRYYVNDANLGMFGNWNQCIALARGRWVTLLHDDDWLAPTFVSTMLPVVEDGFQLAVCRVATGTSGLSQAAVSHALDSSRISRLTIDDLVYGSPTPAPGLLIERQLLIDNGGFDATKYPCADYVAYSICAAKSRSARLHRTLAYYRTSDSQTFKGDTLLQIIRQSIEIKQELLQRAPWLSNITFILSMAFWFRLARHNEVDLSKIKFDSRLNASAFLARVRPIAFGLEVIRTSIKRMVSTLFFQTTNGR
jgi:glycosyltransferase involved in cell wall biosynthesis